MVALVHGQPGLGRDWDMVVERLVDDHRVVAPDRPGYGDDGGPALSMADNADVLADVLSAQGGGPATVVGHSYGGGVAILLAARRPELVRALVLVSSVGRRDSISGFDRVLALPGVGEALSAAGLFTLSRVLPRLRHVADLRPRHAWAWLAATIPDQGYGRTLWSARMWRSFVSEQRTLMHEIADVEVALGSLHLPTTVITGTWDVVVPPAVAVSIATTIGGSELLTVARAGHFVHRQFPGIVSAAVRRLERRAAAAGRDDAEEESRP